MDTETKLKNLMETYKRTSKTVQIGSSIEIPTEAVGIHLEEIPPLESVLVTWFEPVEPRHTGIFNEFTVAEATFDDETVVLPCWAVGLSTGEHADWVSDRAVYLA
jgi:hypothetical protein